MLIIYEGKDKQTEKPKNNVPEHSSNIAPKNWNNSKFDFTEKTGGEQNTSSSDEDEESSEDSDDDDESRNLSAKNSSSTKQNSHICQQLISPSEVTMKIIDFANITFKGFLEDSVIHIGPDSGYLKGIDTLIRILFHALKEINLQEYKKSKY